MRSQLLLLTAAPTPHRPLLLRAFAPSRRRRGAAVALTSSPSPNRPIATVPQPPHLHRHPTRRRPTAARHALPPNGSGGGGFNDDDEDEAEALAALAAVPPREARLIGALLQVGLTGSLAVLLGTATGTDPVARLWRGLGGTMLFGGGDDDALLSTVAAAVAADGSSTLPASFAAALPYFLPLLLLDALLFAAPWSMPSELQTVSPQGRRCLDARAVAEDEDEGGGGVSLATKLMAGLALHRAVALLPPRLVTAAFADGPDEDEEDGVEPKKQQKQQQQPQTREERLAALGLSPPSASAAAAPNPAEKQQPIDDAAALPLPAEAGLIAARELSKELLQRGVLLVFTARWLGDRFVEGGASGDDAFGLGLPASAVAASVAASLLTASIVPAAAGEAAGVRAAAAAALVAASRDVVEAAEQAEEGAEGAEGDDEEEDEDDEDDDDATTRATVNPALLLEFRVLEATDAAMGSLPPAVAGGLSLARLVSLAAAANACFVEQSGNLAATLVGAVAVNEVLGLGYRVWAKKAAEEEKARRQQERRKMRRSGAAAAGGAAGRGR